MTRRKRFVVLLVASICCAALPAHAEPRWTLTYARQHGRSIGQGALLAEFFATDQDGRFVSVGVTNKYNPDTAIFGMTKPASDYDHPGSVRVNFDAGVNPYDFRIFDPGVSSDVTPDCYWNSDKLPNKGRYSFSFHYRKVDDASSVTMFPFAPVYHYDHCTGFNTATREAAKSNSDRNILTKGNAPFQAQTFVVPEGINRIIEAQAFCTRGFSDYRYRASIHDGTPGGPQLGPFVESRMIKSDDFKDVMVAWGLDDIPVVPGKTYSLVVESIHPAPGLSAYVTRKDNYANGMHWNGNVPDPDHDLVAIVVGARYEKIVGLNDSNSDAAKPDWRSKCLLLY